MDIYEIRDKLDETFPHIFGDECLYVRTLRGDRLDLYIDFIKEPYKSKFFKPMMV